MANLPFPLTGIEVDDLRPQVYELIRQIYEDKIGGADLGDVFSLPGEVLTLVLSTNSGLIKTGHMLAINPAADGGISLLANELILKLIATGGLQTTASGVGIKLDGSTLTLSAAGLKVTSSFVPYTIVNHSDNKVLAATDFLKIHVMDVSVGDRTFTLPDIDITSIGQWVILVRKGVGFDLRIITGGMDMILNSTSGGYIECTDALHDWSSMELIVVADGQWMAKPFGIWNTY